MSDITIAIDPATEAKLDEIAAATQRPKADIAAEALAVFARHEADAIAKIKRGMEDVRAGRTVPHDEVMGRADRIIREAEQRRAK